MNSRCLKPQRRSLLSSSPNLTTSHDDDNRGALAAPPAAGAAGFNRFKASSSKRNILAGMNIVATKNRKHRELLDSAPAQVFTTYFRFQHLESGDGRVRLLDNGAPILQHMTTGVTTFDTSMDELMDRVYGPLVPGQERERWAGLRSTSPAHDPV